MIIDFETYWMVLELVKQEGVLQSCTGRHNPEAYDTQTFCTMTIPVVQIKGANNK
jgi:hypothetical protein